MTEQEFEEFELSDCGSFDINDGNFDMETEISNGMGKPLSLEDLQEFKSKVDQTGVVYLSSVPPFMKPIKLRQLLSQYAEIGRIYLVPEDPKITARRKKYKGNKRQNYTEGWVEFSEKKQARAVAQLLNSRNIGGKKRSFYYDDIWNIKYLPRFKWHHLTEQMAYERAVRDQRLRTEMSQARKENAMYLQSVEKGKMIEAMQEKQQKRGETKQINQKPVKQRKIISEPCLKTEILSQIFN